MGYRANYIVRRGGEWHHTSSQSDVLEVDSFVVFGPAVTLRFLAPWPDWNFADWQIETSCQRGALVDEDARVFMLFSEQTGYAERQVLLDTLRRTWAGWRVVWAYNGLADLLRHAGVDPERGRPYGTRHESALYPFGRSGTGGPQSDVWTLVTTRDAGTVRVYGLDGDAVHPWWVGADVLSMLDESTRVDDCPYVPDAGLHLDVRERTAGLWTGATALHDIADEWSALWPGWRLRFWRDDYRQQELAAAGAITLPEPGLAGARARLAARVRTTWQPYLSSSAAGPDRAAEDIEGLRETDWYSYLALRSAVTPDDLERVLAAIRTC